MKSKDYFAIDWNSIVLLDEKSPSGLSWSNNYKFAGWKNYKRNGKPSGWRLEYREKAYYCHRILAILFLNLKDNNLVVNHKDCDPFNNSIENLEICTAKENSRRQSCHIAKELHPTNVSGIVGVSEHTTLDGAKYAKAQWNDLNGKIKCKYFPYKKYGKTEAIELAKNCRRDAINLLHIQDAGYPLVKD